MGNFRHRTLMVSASVSAYTAPALMTVCLLTNYWIYGKQIRLPQNPMTKPGEIHGLNFTYYRIGLWRECSKESFKAPYNCDLVKYSKIEAKSEKGFKAVAYRSAPSMACFTAASALLFVAILLFTRGLCKRRRKAVFFISGLLFSISGLLTMVGVTLYVSITTEESVKIDQDLLVMRCSYGYSFLCAVSSFVLQELTGVLTVYWFIYRFRALVRKQEKLRERTRKLMGNCLSMTTALPLNLASMNAIRSNDQMKFVGNRFNYSLNQNHYPALNNQSTLSNSFGHIQQRRRIPFDRSVPLSSPQADKTVYSIFPPRSPTFLYGDYCRVLIRTEDVNLLSQMVKSKSQAQILTNSRSTTPAPVGKFLANSHTHRQQADNPTRRNTRKGVKRTTSV